MNLTFKSGRIGSIHNCISSELAIGLNSRHSKHIKCSNFILQLIYGQILLAHHNKLLHSLQFIHSHHTIIKQVNHKPAQKEKNTYSSSCRSASNNSLLVCFSAPGVFKTLLCSAILIVVFFSSSCKTRTKISHYIQSTLIITLIQNCNIFFSSNNQT